MKQRFVLLFCLSSAVVSVRCNPQHHSAGFGVRLTYHVARQPRCSGCQQLLEGTRSFVWCACALSSFVKPYVEVVLSSLWTCAARRGSARARMCRAKKVKGCQLSRARGRRSEKREADRAPTISARRFSTRLASFACEQFIKALPGPGTIRNAYSAPYCRYTASIQSLAARLTQTRQKRSDR